MTIAATLSRPARRLLVGHASWRLTSGAMAAPVARTTITQLERYTACDVADALLRLRVPDAGFLSDLQTLNEGAAGGKTVAPVSTVLFAARGETPADPPANIPSDAHWADIMVPKTFVLIKQPAGQRNAVCGGIMALRMQHLGVHGIAVAGRVRDLPELRATGLPVRNLPPHFILSRGFASFARQLTRAMQILAQGLSVVGAGAASVPWAVQVPLRINDCVVNPGDLAFHDPENGLVVIPSNKIDAVLALLPRLTAADEKVKQDVVQGVSVREAFKRHRGA